MDSFRDWIHAISFITRLRIIEFKLWFKRNEYSIGFVTEVAILTIIGLELTYLAIIIAIRIGQ